MVSDTLLDNHVLLASVLAWALAQVSKTVGEIIKERRLVLSRLVSSGGMPSSHSALVTGLATAVGRVMGISSPAFAIAAVLAGIVMYDAAGVRRAVSIQARILNQMIDEAFQGHPFAEKRLRELIGHTPIQVFVGGLLGICVGLLATSY
ncbi:MULTISPECIES: divergent PAP2 family protein [Ktedonobacter]|uniref:Acid phosphatase/vanadium-dependent haloperoxidase related protein n=1 Tax=Ktedonobacter racemifer DSM 44963 TaxID=485913 RepID=D6TL16_KTERA|nr:MULTISPECIES: divergent PAP2 family protein [Ktedonobacter]EFH86466.1 acid phosphatase/vanadium-dependent haloperoxidase related protein [Ktedonobacter racemifer DSM 44963]GHO65802.1 membrane protein [Ktedonobacter sp. SOSP1-52]